jgi:hypothetical protein
LVHYRKHFDELIHSRKTEVDEKHPVDKHDMVRCFQIITILRDIGSNGRGPILFLIVKNVGCPFETQSNTS